MICQTDKRQKAVKETYHVCLILVFITQINVEWIRIIKPFQIRNDDDLNTGFKSNHLVVQSCKSYLLVGLYVMPCVSPP